MKLLCILMDYRKRKMWGRDYVSVVVDYVSGVYVSVFDWMLR